MSTTSLPLPAMQTSTNAWTTFFLTPLPPLSGALVDLEPSRGSVPGRALPTANAIRKQVLLRLWPGVQGDEDRERALLLCCNSHAHASWWIRAGADRAHTLILQQMTVLLAWRTKQAGDHNDEVGTAAAERTGNGGPHLIVRRVALRPHGFVASHPFPVGMGPSWWACLKVVRVLTFVVTSIRKGSLHAGRPLVPCHPDSSPDLSETTWRGHRRGSVWEISR